MKPFRFIKKTVTKATTTKSSEFSRFFREASSEEKRRVFEQVARLANEDQNRVIETAQTESVKAA